MDDSASEDDPSSPSPTGPDLETSDSSSRSLFEPIIRKVSKGSRPMPASARRKLEENESASASPSLQNDESSRESGSSSKMTGEKKTGRPMPASVRKKLEELSKSTDSPQTPGSSASESESKPRARPMPASAKLKLQKSASSNAEGDISITPSSANSKPRPMPASVRKKLEESPKGVNEDRSSSRNSSNREGAVAQKDSATPTSSKPMPASAKRKLETKLEDASEAASSNVEKTEEAPKKTDLDSTKKSRPMPASARRKLEEATNAKDKPESEETLHAAEQQDAPTSSSSTPTKINISLGGIKFPTFSKPMPASVRQKMEAKQDAETASKIEEDQKPAEEPANASRNSAKVSKELASLQVQEYACQYCGLEFYSLSKKNNHEKNHLMRETKSQNSGDTNRKEDEGKGKSEEAKAKERGSSSGKKSSKSSNADKYCPHCSKRIPNRKKLSAHVYKCGLPRKFACEHCDKTFKYEGELQAHVFRHEVAGTTDRPKASSKTSEVVDSSHAGGSYRRDSVSSRGSSQTSRAMPQSVKDRLERTAKQKDTDQVKGVPQQDKSSAGKSLKRKIEEVLCSVDSKLELGSSEEETPKKKIILSSEGKGRPMPASVRKKLQESDNQAKVKKEVETIKVQPEVSDVDDDDVDDDECEICHRVFSSSRKRQKHEKSVHFIENPRGSNEKEEHGEPAVPPTSEHVKTESLARKSTDIRTDKRGSKVVSASVAETSNKAFSYQALPAAGTCPICGKGFATKLKRHVVSIHFNGDKEAALMAKTFPTSSPSISQRRSSTSSSDKKGVQPLKILSPGYQRTFKMYKTNKKKSETKSSAPEADDQVSDDDDNHHMAGSDVDEEAQEPESIIPVKSNAVPSKKIVSGKSKPTGLAHSSKESKSKLTPANANFKCEKCPETFLVQADYTEHMKTKHPPEMVLRCKICGNIFSASMGLILHVKLRHTDEAEKYIKEVKAKLMERYSDPVEEKSHQNISQEEEPRSPEPDSMDTHSVGDENDKDPDYEAEQPSPMEVEEGEDEPAIAITSTFSQKEKTPPKSSLDVEKSKSLANNLNEMSCSSCSEKFYNFEALRKHELYFHNVKTIKMCPICGVYPSRLGRHLIAHENKTVRCSCVPCNLNFLDFGELLKHNLEKHPGPDGGALSASNKPKEVASPSENFKKESDYLDASEEAYECTLCHKELSGAAQGRRHVRRNHEEYENEPADKFIRKKGTIVPKEDEKGSKPENNVAKRSNRPMPASVRAKLQAQSETKSDVNSDPKKDVGDRDNRIVASASSGNETPKVNAKPRPMPASVRAKLAAKEKEDNDNCSSPSAVTDVTPTSKPSRPMPASVRAKLMASSSLQSTPTSGEATPKSAPPKPNRPMPASVRANLLKSSAATNSEKATTAIAADGNSSEPEILLESEPPPKECLEITLSDDDDIIVEQDFSFPQPEMISIHHDVDTVPIDHDLEIEHEKAVKITVGSSVDSVHLTYQCKICSLSLDSRDKIRQHILRMHREYTEHAENLIEVSYEEHLETDSRSRSRKYKNSDDEDDDDEREDDEDEVIIPRGTTRRPRGPSSIVGLPTSSRKSVPALDQWGFQCKLCGDKRSFEAPGSVRRHISRAHPEIPATQRDELVVKLDLETGKEANLVPEPQNADIEATISCLICGYCCKEENYADHYKSNHPGSFPYHCEYCTASFYLNAELTEHVARDHYFAVDVLDKQENNEDETEIQIDDVSGTDEIKISSISTLTPQLESISPQNTSEPTTTTPELAETPQPKPKGYRPGPASRKAKMMGSTTSSPGTSQKQQDTASPSESSSRNAFSSPKPLGGIMMAAVVNDEIMELD